MKKYRRLSNTLIFMLSKSYKVITFANSNVINASSSNQFYMSYNTYMTLTSLIN